MNENKTSGRLIVIEGLDGSGKATQTKLLCDKLSRLDIEYTKLSFPNYDSPSSALVKMYLNGELAASERFHDPDTQTVACDDVVFASGILQRPVEIVALDLHEFKHAFVFGQYFFQKIAAAVEREAQMTDLSFFLELQDVRDDVILFRFVDLYRPLVDVVQKIEIKIVGVAAVQRDIEQSDVVDRSG